MGPAEHVIEAMQAEGRVYDTDGISKHKDFFLLLEAEEIELETSKSSRVLNLAQGRPNSSRILKIS
jgi:hypothetical protein